MQAERTNESVLTLRHSDVASGWEQRYLLMADVHWDNPHCDRRLLVKHLEQAKALNAGILVFGDWFCAMQGKWDKRADKSDLRPEHREGNYLDLLVDTAATYLEPYRQNLVMLADGNHETAIRSHLETDLLMRLCQKLDTNHMGYSGFVRFMFSRNSGGRSSRVLYWHHGAGGGGPVTKGVIGANRHAASVEADIFVQGHIHEAWVVENVMAQLSDAGHVRYRTQVHCQLPTYKQEYDMPRGYHVEKGRPPKPLGAWWLVWYFDRTQPGQVGCRFERAN